MVRIDQYGTNRTGADQIVIGGQFNGVGQAAGGTSSVSLSGGTGHNTVVLADRTNDINIGGGQNGIQVGKGRNNISLLAAVGFNAVLTGNGDDTVTVNGPGNHITVGDGNDLVSTTGNSNAIIAGNGNDTISLAAGSGNVVRFGTGNDTVTGTSGGGNNQIFGSDISTSTVTISLDTQPGNLIVLGNGHDTVFDNGNNVSVTAGNGNDTVTANGNNVFIQLGNGNNLVTANGNGDVITLGTPGAGGSNTLFAEGTNDTITLYGHDGATPSIDTSTIGSYSTFTAHGGIQNLTVGNVAPTPVFSGNGDVITYDNTIIGSTTNLYGNNDTLALTNNANDIVTTGAANGGELIEVFGNAGTYTGSITLNNFGLNTDTLDLQGLGYNHLGAGPGGFDPQLNATNTAYVAALPGGGQITFTAPVIGGFNATDIKFS